MKKKILYVGLDVHKKSIDVAINYGCATSIDAFWLGENQSKPLLPRLQES